MTAAPSPSVASLRKEFGEAIERHVVSCGDTIVYASRDRVHDVLAWLKDTPGENYNYLTDITAVDYRDPERALEVVWQIRALDRPADLRVKVAIPTGQPLEVPTVWDLWRGANWLEREVFDMFGVLLHRASRPAPHPDVGDVRRGLSAPEELPAARALQPVGADAPGARRASRSRTTRWKSSRSPMNTRTCRPTCGSG